MPPATREPDLAPWQVDTIEIFIRAADVLGIPKSVGQTYGLLFVTEAPLSMEAIQVRLGISKGSASQSLQFLRRVSAIKPVYIPGERRDHYQPELEIKRLLTGFLKDQVEPHLDSGKSRLAALDNQKGDIPPEIQKRLRRLQGWRARAEKLLPLIVTVLGGAGKK